jgi:hypothetical protein
MEGVCESSIAQCEAYGIKGNYASETLVRTLRKNMRKLGMPMDVFCRGKNKKEKPD